MIIVHITGTSDTKLGTVEIHDFYGIFSNQKEVESHVKKLTSTMKKKQITINTTYNSNDAVIDSPCALSTKETVTLKKVGKKMVLCIPYVAGLETKFVVKENSFINFSDLKETDFLD